MDYDTPIDHSCDAWEADQSIIPKISPKPYDQFFIKINAQIASPVLLVDHDQYLQVGDEDYLLMLNEIAPTTTTNTMEYWVPRDQLICNTTSWSTISVILTSVNVPIHVQPFMIHRISSRARSMARASHNVGKKVLPMIVSIHILDCVEEYSQEDVNVRVVPAAQSSVATLEKVKVEGSGSDTGTIMQCVICLEDILKSSDPTRMPCSHVYHGDCIVQWLGVSNFCPLCRFQMPTSN